MPFWISAALAPLCGVWMVFFLLASERKAYQAAFRYKALAGLCFLLTGILFLPGCGAPVYAALVCCGLFFGLLGDQLLALRYLLPERHDRMFLLGGVAFAVGHFLYLAALLYRFGFDWRFLPFFTVYLALSAFYARWRRVDAGKFLPPGVAYIALVALMAATAAAAALRGGAAPLLFGVGGLCFLVSDMLLCAGSFGAAKRRAANLALHIFYYAAQLCIAWSIFFV